jgi:hypothetical protein
MSGLGAQARAAEYAAATAARARQVSREAEDQKLPPKAAPISLSALAKAQSTSRNKGPKAWKPLNLDEITESSDEGSTGKDSGRGTPANSSRAMLEWTSSFANRQVSASSTCVDGIKVHIPTAPRAMITSNVPTSINANPSPQRRQKEPPVKMPIRQSTQDIYQSPIPFGHGGFPYPVVPPQPYSCHPNLLGSPPRHEAAHFQRFGSMMVPSDLSPTKQQQKFSLLGQMHHPAYSNDPVETPEDVLPHRMLSQDSPSYYEPLNTASAETSGETYGWDISAHVGTHVDYRVNQHSFQEHINAGYGGDGEEGEDEFCSGTSASGHSMIQLPYGMTPMSYTFNGSSVPIPHHAHTTTIPGGGYQHRRSSLLSRSENKGQPHPATYEHEEPYDRKSRMQRFVAEATHEALARKGKTVLHNPDLYKERDQSQQNAKPARNDTDPSLTSSHMDNRVSEDESRDKKRYRPVPWAVRPRLSDRNWEAMPLAAEEGKQSKANIPPSLSKDELEIMANAICKSTTPEILQLESRNTLPNDPINGELTDKRLNPIDRVGSEEWTKFRPITSFERERVRACMAKAAADLAPNIPRPGLFDKKESSNGVEDDLKHSQEWFYRDFRGEQSFRAQLPAIAEKHAALRRAVAMNANGGALPKDFKLGVDDGIAANIMVGEVIATLASYVIGDRKSADQRKNFHKVKSVPEFATERGGVSSGSGSSDSYFDDVDAGFQGAPVRIARDPRFRPQGKDGLKLKPEEEWKNRHEMYGRRVL